MKRPGGFTLLEVMVALAIAIPALVVLYRQGAAALGLTGTAFAYEEALSRAQSHIAALAAGGITVGEREGDDGAGYHWRVRATQAATLPARNGPGTTLYDVQVQIAWGARAVALDTRILAPTPAR